MLLLRALLRAVLDVVPVGIDVRHDLVDPNLLQIVLIVGACFLVSGIPIDLVVLAEGLRVARATQVSHLWFLHLSELVLKDAVVEVLDPLVPRLEVVSLEIKRAITRHNRHADVIQLFGQAVA